MLMTIEISRIGQGREKKIKKIIVNFEIG